MTDEHNLRDIYEADTVVLKRQAEEIARLRTVLQPFADEAATYDTDDDDPDDLSYLIPSSLRLRIEEGDGTLTESIISVGDLRKARAELAGISALRLDPPSKAGEGA